MCKPASRGSAAAAEAMPKCALKQAKPKQAGMSGTGTPATRLQGKKIQRHVARQSIKSSSVKKENQSILPHNTRQRIMLERERMERGDRACTQGCKQTHAYHGKYMGRAGVAGKGGRWHKGRW